MARFAVFKVVLQEPATGSVSIDYHTVAGTAVEGDDYTPLSGTLAFNPGEVEKEVRVPVRSADQVSEESFTLVLSNPVGLVLGRTPATATLPAGSSPPNELEGIYVNRVLGVLFMPGEKHPGDGPELSDDEWVLAPGEGTLGGAPYPGIFGEINYDLGGPILLCGAGAIVTLSGWWVNYLVQDPGDGSGIVQVIVNNTDTVDTGQDLAPETAAAFNAWWLAKGPVNAEFLDSADAVVVSIPVTQATENARPGGFAQNVPWNVADMGAVVKLRFVPGTPGV